jgi:hypothetical protein
VIAASISAGAYAATGNKKMAITMGITAAAAMLPGGGAMVKLGKAVQKSAGRVVGKAGGSVVKLTKSAASCKCRGALPASSAMAGKRLAADLARRELRYARMTGAGRKIMGPPFRSWGNDWEKRQLVQRGTGRVWHWMYNNRTSKVAQFKLKGFMK